MKSHSIYRKMALTAVMFAASFAIASVSEAADFGSSTKDNYYTEPAVQQQRSWTGLYLGGNVGYQIGDVDVNASSYNMGASVDGLSTNGWKYGVRGGFDWHVGNSPFVIGAFVGYDWGESDFDVSVSGIGNVVNATIEPTWHVGARAGLVVNPNTLMYVGYAFGQGEFDVNLNPAFGNVCGAQGVNCSDTLNSHTFLAGAEMRITDSVSTALEYNYTMYDDMNLYSAPNSSIKAEPDVHSVMLRVNWRPNFNLF